MKKRNGWIAIFLFCWVFGFPFNGFASDAPMWFVEDLTQEEAILNPGTTTYCDKDFNVENMGEEWANVQVILGNGANYSFDMIEPGGSKSYSLNGEYPMAGVPDEARVTPRDEARIVNTTAGDANLRIHCK